MDILTCGGCILLLYHFLCLRHSCFRFEVCEYYHGPSSHVGNQCHFSCNTNFKVFYTALEKTVSLTRMDDAQIKFMQFRSFVILLNTNIKLSFKSKFIISVCNKLSLWRALVCFPTSSFLLSHVTQSFTITASLVQRCQMLNCYFFATAVK